MCGREYVEENVKWRRLWRMCNVIEGKMDGVRITYII